MKILFVLVVALAGCGVQSTKKYYTQEELDEILNKDKCKDACEVNEEKNSPQRCGW